jgi:hypothetical protein
MHCHVCGGDRFSHVEYTAADDVRAPAFECVRCHAIGLDEAAARSEEERESVRLAKAARAAQAAAPASKVRAIPRG